MGPLSLIGVAAEAEGLRLRRSCGLAARRAGWLGGAAVFGVGWGLAGICPGPAFADIVTFAPGVLVFIAAMLAAMLAVRTVRRSGATASFRQVDTAWRRDAKPER